MNEETDNQWSTVNTLERRDFRISIKWNLKKNTISEKKKGLFLDFLGSTNPLVYLGS